MNTRKLLLSVGIIFKNEIRCLERCLKSLEPLREMLPMEVVMADTGSDDGSREVAEKYADIVFDFPWINDFAAARNAVMERCSGEWYMTIDCDEWLGGQIEELPAFIRQKKEYDYGSVTIRNYSTNDFGPMANYADFDTIRLIRMSTGTCYVGTIHEHLKIPEGTALRTMLLSKMLFHHDGYAAEAWAMKDKKKRNIDPLKKELEADPENLILILQYLESGGDEPDYLERLRQAVDMVKGRIDGWDRAGTAILRCAVITAAQNELPELDDWIALAEEWFPDSMFTRIDVGYFAFGTCWNRDDFAGAIRWGEDYLRAVKAYEARDYDIGSTAYSSVLAAAPHRQQSVRTLLAGAYVNVGQMDNALKHLKQVKGELFDGKQAEDFVRICVNLYSRSTVDAAPVFAKIWEDLDKREEDKGNCRRRFLNRAAGAFSLQYREAQEKKPDFCRHAYTMFRDIPGCPLSLGAAMLDTQDAAELTGLLSQVDKWDEFPACALEHAILCGAQFPPEPWPLEQMDQMAVFLAKDASDISRVVQIAVDADLDDPSKLNWARAITTIAVRIQNWKEETADISLARCFAKAEQAFVSRCYAPGVLTEEKLPLLPETHRFGWYCGQAFVALDAGDAVGYVQLLRKGLAAYEGVKNMVEFLLNHTPQLHTPEPSAELAALAEQIRAMLARFAPDDPAVAVLKQSEAYQKVAYLIEGMEAPVVGGLLQ